MRHRIAGNTLNRKTSHRKATVRDIAKATLLKERICTTKAKAKEARKLVDKLITLGKKGTLADKRRAFSILCDHKIVSDLFGKTSPRFKNRLGGYTRIILLGVRRGDSAQLAYLELTEKEEIIISKPKSTAAAKKEDLKVKDQRIEKNEPTKHVGKDKTPIELSEDSKVQEVEIVEGSEAEKSEVNEVARNDKKKVLPPKKEAKSAKSFTGGLRRMFKRKTPDS